MLFKDERKRNDGSHQYVERRQSQKETSRKTTNVITHLQLGTETEEQNLEHNHINHHEVWTHA